MIFPRFIPRTILLALLTLMAVACAPQQAHSTTELNGGHVRQITDKFLKSHYSQEVFGEERSAIMLRMYIDRFDPGRYYFLRSDINLFEREKARLAYHIRRNNIEMAFTIYKRFINRLEERDKYIQGLLDAGFDMNKDETVPVDRKDAAFPVSTAQAESLLRKRLKLETLELMLGGETEEEAIKRVRNRYRTMHFRYRNFSHNEVVSAYVNAFTATFDPHSSYMSPDDLENFNISMRLSFEGIGATLRWEDGYTVISSIIPGGAASKEGSLMPEDRILGVAQGADGEWEDVYNQRLSDVVKLIRGRRGTMVRLSITRKVKGLAAKRMEIRILRDKILLKESEAKGEILQVPRDGGKPPMRFGVINLPSFYSDFQARNANQDDYKSASRDMEKILEEFKGKKVDGVLLDLRNNGGGSLDEATAIAGLFLHPGPLLLSKNYRGAISMYSNRQRKIVYDGPMVLMVNRYSASASEIVAGALQDYGRAILVGDNATYGKGTVQNIIGLPEGMGALKATVAKFYRPGSASTQNRGVEPDIVLPSLNNHLEIGEATQPNALPWDTIQRASFQPWSDLDAVLPILQQRSTRRVETEQYFRLVREEVADYLKHRKGRTHVTLSQVRTERKLAEDAMAAAKPKETHGKDGEKVRNGLDVENDAVLRESMQILKDYIEMDGPARNAAGMTGQQRTG